MITVVSGSTTKPVAAQQLADFFSSFPAERGFLYIGYPIIGTADGPYHIDALLVSQDHGLVVFSLVENKNLENIQEIQDDIFNKLDSKLRIHKSLIKGRDLQIKIYPVTFAPSINDNECTTDDYPVCNEATLRSWLESRQWDTPEYYENLLSVVQAISNIRKNRKNRNIQQENSRGFKLKCLEDSIANLDNRQGRAVIETVEGVQRIRGLAGSGKTIVLALKAAYLHAQHPDWKIAVTFNTRSLKGQFRRLINTFTIEQTNEEPNWDNVQIIHAWGASGGGDKNGIYYSFCQINGVEYHDYASARHNFGAGKEFSGSCQKALDECSHSKEIYDVILVDEAQDFDSSFLVMCYELLNAPKRLVYAYDELQNLSSQSLPAPEDIFGKDINGVPRVRFDQQAPGRPQQDIILEKCYRNSRPILATAHALGFGIYKQPDEETGLNLVQIFDNKKLWIDIGYTIKDGALDYGSDVCLSRSEESSPVFLENHSDIDDLIQFHHFDSKEEQDEWVSEEIYKNLFNDELRPDDIIVINPNPLSTKKNVGLIRSNLFDRGINSHLAGVDTMPDVFFEENRDSIVFTGIYRAKGNEAGMVYIINAQDCYSSFANIANVRNRLFTAITRSKAWVRVLGVGKKMKELEKEFLAVKTNNFNLNFKYPTVEEHQYLNILNRDMSEYERNRLRKNKNDLSQIIEDLDAGRIYIEDFSPRQVRKLKDLFEKRG